MVEKDVLEKNGAFVVFNDGKSLKIKLLSQLIKFFKDIIGLFIIGFLFLYTLFSQKLFFQKNNRKKVLIHNYVFLPFFYNIYHMLKQKGYEIDFLADIIDVPFFEEYPESRVITHKEIIKNRILYYFKDYILPFYFIKNYHVWFSSWDSFFLDRTSLWRIELFLYRLFNKKVVVTAYGSDIWDLIDRSNIYRRFSLLGSFKFYFKYDFKRINRYYFISKYANYVIGTSDAYLTLPRIDFLKIFLHVYPYDKDKYRFSFKDNGKIKVFHVAAARIKKGTHFIEDVFKRLEKKYKDKVEFKSLIGIKREELLKEMEESHIFIEQVSYGVISMAATEALLKGNVVFSNIDKSMEQFYKFLLPEYYDNFFKELPIINIEKEELEEKLERILNMGFDKLQKIADRGRRFIEQEIDKNLEIFEEILIDE